MPSTKPPLLAVVLSLTLVSNAFADEAEQPDEAKAAFDEGANLFAAGDYPAAADAFRRAYEIKPSWRLLYNIGQSEAAAKRHGLAMEAFERYLSEGGDDIDEARRVEVTSEIERLRSIVGTIEVVAPDGSTVAIDGVERGTTPLSGRLKIAASVEHEVEIRSGDELLLTRKVSVGSRENLIVELVSDEEATAPAPEPASPREEKSDEDAPAQPQSALSTAGWIALGTGGALVITGAVTGLVALSRNKQLVNACDDADGCAAGDYREVRDARDAMATTSTVTFAVGAAAVTAGVIMLIVGRGDGEEAPPAGDGAEVSIAPSLGPELVGAAIAGRF